MLVEVHRWLLQYRKLEVQNYINATNLVSPETWAYYQSVCDLGIEEEFQEQRVLREKTGFMVEKWKNRPALLKSKSHAPKKTEEAASGD